MHDVVIIGGGQNGLVCSGYLARLGQGSSCISAPWWEVQLSRKSSARGFPIRPLLNTVCLLNPKIIRDLNLAVHGLRIVECPAANFLPLDDGRQGFSQLTIHGVPNLSISMPNRRAQKVSWIGI